MLISSMEFKWLSLAPVQERIARKELDMIGDWKERSVELFWMSHKNLYLAARILRVGEKLARESFVGPYTEGKVAYVELLTKEYKEQDEFINGVLMCMDDNDPYYSELVRMSVEKIVPLLDDTIRTRGINEDVEDFRAMVQEVYEEEEITSKMCMELCYMIHQVFQWKVAVAHERARLLNTVGKFDEANRDREIATVAKLIREV